MVWHFRHPSKIKTNLLKNDNVRFVWFQSSVLSLKIFLWKIALIDPFSHPLFVTEILVNKTMNVEFYPYVCLHSCNNIIEMDCKTNIIRDRQIKFFTCFKQNKLHTFKNINLLSIPRKLHSFQGAVSRKKVWKVMSTC